MTEEKIYLEQGVMVSDLFGSDRANVTRACELFDVKISELSGVLRINGVEGNVNRAVDFCHRLIAMLDGSRKRIDAHDFELVYKSFKQKQENELQKLFAERVKLGTRKKDVLPRTMTQLNYIRAIREHELVFGVGPAGTGKTYLAMAMAVEALMSKKCERIILSRPARESGENLGFLPGTLEEKIAPYLRPLYDALYAMIEFEQAKALIERNIVEVAPLAFMRGRTLNNAFIILDEAQNATSEQMLMFLTRLGFGSRCVVTGDPAQSDLIGSERSGLLEAEQRLSAVEEIAFCHFTPADVVRHQLVEKIIRAYEKH